jgi:alpha-glucosidase/alpha-D-xyloside xylohydrolase
METNWVPDPSELRNSQVEPILRKYLELRYSLMPYLYSAVREGQETGLPLMRALWLHYPDDATAVTRGDQFMWGPDILVAPVVERGATQRRVWLPRGTWYDYWTNERVEGGREITRAVDLSTTPLYVRAGAVIPLDPVRQHVDEPVSERATLLVFPGASGVSRLYEDDGRTFNHRRGDWMGVDLSWDDAGRRLALALRPGSRMRAPSPREFRVKVAGVDGETTLRFQGRRVSIGL